MNLALFAPPAFILLLFAVLIVLASRDWRWTIIALGLQYVSVFVLTSAHWPLEMSSIKLIAGWMATAILGATQSSGLSGTWERARPSGALFRLLAGGLVALIVVSVAPDALLWVPQVGLFPAMGGLLLIGCGVLMLGLTARPLRVVLGLLMVFAGFEVFYAAVERSTLVAGLLALVNLSLAMVGAYLSEAAEIEGQGGGK